MQTLTIDILNDKALKPLKELEVLKLIRVRRKPKLTEILAANGKAQIAEENPLDSLFGLWEDKGISLEEIRKKAWERKR